MRHFTLSIVALIALASNAQPGSLDPTFGNNGKVLVPSLGAGLDDQSVTAVMLPDDKILVAGRSSNGVHFNSVLLRFNADGTPDLTFGTDGLVEHDLGGGSEFIRSAALDGQGRLVVGGQLFSDPSETNSDMFVARFLSDGSLDPSFGGTGLIVRDLHTTPDAEEAHEVLVQPDGKIVLCGFTGPSLEFTEIVVERYLENGGLDPSFGGDGSVLAFISNGSGEQVRGAVLGPNGDIYFCGYVIPLGESEQAILLGRVDAEGDSPSDFGNNNGHTSVPMNGSNLIARTVALMPEGRLVVAGAKRTPGASQARFIYTFDAVGDGSFSRFQDNPDGGDAWNSLLVQNDGAVIAGGNEADGPDSRNWDVERFIDSDLIVDGGFESVDYDEDGGEETCFDMEFTSDGSIIGIGDAQVAGVNRIVLLKYLNDISSGVAEDPSSPVVSAFPNPASDNTTITLSDVKTAAVDLTLSDAAGRVLRQWTQQMDQGSSFKIDLADLSPGVYSVGVESGVHTSTLKLIVQ